MPVDVDVDVLPIADTAEETKRLADLLQGAICEFHAAGGRRPARLPGAPRV
jgi:hypothetical protein